MTASNAVPALQQDIHLIEKLAHFNRERSNPATSYKDPDLFWDLLPHTPESVHQVTILLSDGGTPRSYRHMSGGTAMCPCNPSGAWY